jgi:glutamate dehydrogenase/leucine dehydrogenase
VYFAEEMLDTRKEKIRNKTAVISGSGNVAQYAAEKVIQLGGKVLTMSDSDGYVFDKSGIDQQKLEWIMWLKNEKRGRIKEYVEKFGGQYVKGKTPWEVKCEIALPCATQNELDESDAKMLTKNGCIAVAEGANMPCTIAAVEWFLQKGILYAPGKASNAGGVAVSGLEMSQNSLRLSWTREEVDARLKEIMHTIHQTCEKYGREGKNYINYVKGANIGGFVKVADAMLAQGLV